MDVKTQPTLTDGSQTALLRSVQHLLGRSERDVLWLVYRLRPQHGQSVALPATEAAKMLRLGVSTVRRAFRKLESIGFVCAHQNVGRHGTEGNSYSIQWNELEIAHDAGRVVEMTDEKALLARDASGRFRRSKDGLDGLEVLAINDEQSEFGTEDEGTVKSTVPARSNRPGRPGQIDRAGTVDLTVPSLFCFPTNTQLQTPTPKDHAATLQDADWLVVGDELKIFGIWSDRIPALLSNARSSGMTPQTVSGLVRYAASKVIALDDAGQPVEQWRLPQPDALDLSQTQPERIYFWGPPEVCRRIAAHEPWMGVASEWRAGRDIRARYAAAEEKLAAKVKQREPASAPVLDHEHTARAAVIHAEQESLETGYGAALAELSLYEVLELLPAFMRPAYAASGKDPRESRLSRLQLLRGLAAKGKT